ncbi:MAG TPA: hypothetical protein VJ483_06540 [Holophagaceae bacterium]|nr:hypothetical protein [Holophagaceae bacterium]
MIIFRWILAVACLGIWAMAAWANAEIVFGRRYRDAERRPSLVMFMGGIFAALGLWALPLQGTRVRATCLAVWLLMALLDMGTLGSLLLGLWAAVSGKGEE